VTDLAEAIAPGAEIDIVGIRPGEKLHEEMISEDDARRTVAFDDYYAIQPVLAAWQRSSGADSQEGGKSLPDGFAYRSDNNDLWLGVDEIRDLLETM
jgi:UDP-N-acetylglucosamine 4,6-dehydratase